MLEIRLSGGTSQGFARMIGVLNEADVRRFWPDIVQDTIHPWFLRTVAENFAKRGALAGESWDYSTEPQYKRWKQKKLGNTVPMRWLGGKERLYPSLTDPRHPEHIFRVGQNSVTLGSSVDHAFRLTRPGTSKFGEKRPGRTIVPSNPQSNKTLVTDIQKNLRRRLAEAGKRIYDVRSNL